MMFHYNDGYIDYHYNDEFDIDVLVSSRASCKAIDATSNFTTPLGTFNAYCELLSEFTAMDGNERRTLEAKFKDFMIETLAVDPKDLEEEE